MAGPPKQTPRQGELAIQNRGRPRQAEEAVPSVRMTRATSAGFTTEQTIGIRLVNYRCRGQRNGPALVARGVERKCQTI
jgi:hypothetical protein